MTFITENQRRLNLHYRLFLISKFNVTTIGRYSPLVPSLLTRSKETIAKFKFMHNYFYEHNSYATFTYCQSRGWRCLAYFSHPHLFLLPASANKSKKKLILTWPAAITLVRVCLLLSVTCPSSNTLAKALTSQLKHHGNPSRWSRQP